MKNTIHLITLSGNSKRFTNKGYSHKALCSINGKSLLELFVYSWPDFKEYESIFLCRNEDIQNTDLMLEIKRIAPQAKIHGIDSNNLGPVYSISRIFNILDDNRPILVSYIDTLQKTSIGKLEKDFEGYDGGLTIHDFKNPHWKTNKSYCLVEYENNMLVTRVVEKHQFTNEDFLSKNKAGSSGNYFFKNCKTMKEYCNFIMDNNMKVNDEFYVTQAIEYMAKDGLKVKAHLCDYASMGIPEDLEDYEFWERWHNDTNIS